MRENQVSKPATWRPCPACGGTQFDPLVVVRNTPIRRCAGCRLATWDWGSFDPTAFYDESYWKSADVGKGYADYFAMAGAMQYTHAHRLAWIQRLLRTSAAPTPESAHLAAAPALLDAGCGPGFFVKAAANAGFTAAGVEISEFAANFARQELGLNVWPGGVRRAELGRGPYDVVTLWDVIEHLPDPTDSLAAINSVLRPGGLLVLSTGDVDSLVAKLSGARWHLFTLPEHLWFFNRQSLRRLLARTGFGLLQCKYEVCWYTTRYLVERLESVFGARRRTSKYLGALGRIPIPVTLADIVTCAAIKLPDSAHRRI
jgi:2-polyprenyl-3-methyl-5-hydroxy-6-metoxy-1,4-benzoquinol methylase